MADATKKEIPLKNIAEMLTNVVHSKKIAPLIEDVISIILANNTLRDGINKLFKDQKNEDLDKAVIRLQEELQNIYKLNYEGVAGIRRPDWSKVSIGSAATPNIAGKGGGGKRRRTKKRKNYKKRRMTKHR